LKNTLHASLLHRLSIFDKDVAYQLSEQHQSTVVVVGSGGREHALAVALAQSPLVGHVICCPGNAGTAREGGKISNNSATAADDVLSFIQQNLNNIDMVVIGPEGPLVDRFVNSLQLHCPQTRVFEPTKDAAQLEASKVNTTQHVLGELYFYTYTSICTSL
jgi:phosphoribosylamine-glycine ligase